MDASKDPALVFSKEYYDSYSSESRVPYARDQKVWIDFFQEVAHKIKLTLSPRSVMDFGCALGFLVENLRDIGIEAYGLDISEYAISEVRNDIKPFCFVGSVSEPLSIGKKYDLLTCIEVLEHLSEEEGVKAIQNMIQYSDTILFSSAPNNSNESTHINVQPAEYWISLFGKFGYTLDLLYDASFVSPNALLFRKRRYLDFSLSSPLRLLILSENTNDACGEVRLFRPLDYLENQGRVSLRIFSADKKQPPAIENLDWADIVIFQRVRSLYWKPYLKYAKKKRIPIVYEIDDNLLEIPQGHPQYSYMNKLKNKIKYSWYLHHADGITTSTLQMASYLKGFNKNIFLLQNYIDSNLCPQGIMKRKNTSSSCKIFTIGYAGTPTHLYEFPPVSIALKKINRFFSGKIQFSFVGCAPSKLLSESNFSYDGRIIPYLYYLNHIKAKKMDVAVAPLGDNFFNQFKSNIKFLEYSLVGIPGVYSKVGPYKDIIKDGVTGFLVEENNYEQWFNKLKCIIEKPETLEAIRFNAHKFVNASFLLKDHFCEWWDTYLCLLMNARGDLK